MATKLSHEALQRKVEQLEQDLLKRKSAEASLKKSEEKYRSLFASSKDGIAYIDLDGHFLDANHAHLNMHGYTLEEIRKLSLHQIKAKKWRREGDDVIEKQAREQGYSDEHERENMRKDGTEFPVAIRVWLMRDGEGAPTGMWSIIRDITERKQAEQALKEREVELEIKSRNLEEMNAALRVLLKQRDEDRTELENRVLSTVKELVFPYLERLSKSGLGATQKAYLDTLASTLNDIISPFAQRLSSTYVGLTPAEMQVASLVKEGKTTKEIAELLHVAPRTVKSHREHIRKKIGIKNQRANLRSRLLAYN
jgi:PAS domain S-box-containing protein